MDDKKIKNQINILFGFIIILVIILCVLLAVYFEHKNEIDKKLESCVREKFEEINQPLVYTKNIKIAPGNCKPYSGCFFPSSQANPINPRTGKRPKPPRADEIWCELSWRDCNAYQSCVNNKCVSKLQA